MVLFDEIVGNEIPWTMDGVDKIIVVLTKRVISQYNQLVKENISSIL